LVPGCPDGFIRAIGSCPRTLESNRRLIKRHCSGPTTYVGSGLSETFNGLGGRDSIRAGGGNDRIWGGTGNDVLMGRDGFDVFVFDTKPNKSTNKDHIVDFGNLFDSIWLDNKVFTKLGKKGSEKSPAAIKKSFFASEKAKDKDDYIVYSKKKGTISYDADGSGSKYKAIEFARVKKGTTVTHSDFYVI
jgi:Ca2+-binding RTX toxin-like protein